MSDLTKAGDHSQELVPAEPLADPGLPAHVWRPTDVDPKAEKRAERQVAAMFGFSMVCSVLFVVAYFGIKNDDGVDTFLGLGAQNVALGVSLGMGLLLIGLAIIQLARKLMADREMVEYRHSAASPAEDREEAIAGIMAGIAEAGIGRRSLVRNSMIGALGLLGLPAVVALRDLGPLPGDSLQHTIWKRGTYVVRDVVGTRINISDIVLGDLINAEPETLFEVDEHGEHVLSPVERQITKAKAAVILFRMEPDEITPTPERANWAIDGVVAFSKICTHVGCPISLNERQTHHLLCPCHQSTFDLGNNGRVVFGPAARALPQLPLALDEDGFLMAQSDFTEPVGPSFWERG